MTRSRTATSASQILNHARAGSAAALLAAACAIGLAGCDRGTTPPPPAATRDAPQSVLGKTAKLARDTAASVEQQQASTGALADSIGTKAGEQAAAGQTDSSPTFVVSGITFSAPSSWQRGPGSQFRVAEFTAPGDVSVTFFNSGGTTDGNIDRWKNQVKGDGNDNKFAQESRTIGSVIAQYISMEGTYSGMSRSGAAAPAEPGIRFFGVILESGPGPVQIRMTGKVEAVRAAEPALKSMVEKMKVR